MPYSEREQSIILGSTMSSLNFSGVQLPNLIYCAILSQALLNREFACLIKMTFDLVKGFISYIDSSDSNSIKNNN